MRTRAGRHAAVRVDTVVEQGDDVPACRGGDLPVAGPGRVVVAVDGRVVVAVDGDRPARAGWAAAGCHAAALSAGTGDAAAGGWVRTGAAAWAGLPSHVVCGAISSPFIR